LVYDRNGNKMPNRNHAGVYSTIRAYLEAVARKKSDDGLQVVEKMKDDEIRCLRI
jgi:branched-chain amino acid transport system substrate-binding protein